MSELGERREATDLGLVPSEVELPLKAVQPPEGEVVKHGKGAVITVKLPGHLERDMIPVRLRVDGWTKERERPSRQKKHPFFGVHSHIIYSDSDPARALNMMSSFSVLREQVEHILGTQDLNLCQREAPRDIFIRSKAYTNALDRSTSKSKDPLHPLITESMPDDWTIGSIPLERFFVHLKPREPEPQAPSDPDSDEEDEEVLEQADLDYQLYIQERDEWENRPRAIDFVELDVLAFAAKLEDPSPATPRNTVSLRGGNRGTPPSAAMASRAPSGVPCGTINVVLVGPVASDPDSGTYVFDAGTCVEVKHFPVSVNQLDGRFTSGSLREVVMNETRNEAVYRGKLGEHSSMFYQAGKSDKMLTKLVGTEAMWSLINENKKMRSTSVQLRIGRGRLNEEKGDRPYDPANMQEGLRYSLAAQDNEQGKYSPPPLKRQKTRGQRGNVSRSLHTLSKDFVLKVLYGNPSSPWYHGFTYEIVHSLATFFEGARYGGKRDIYAWTWFGPETGRWPDETDFPDWNIQHYRERVGAYRPTRDSTYAPDPTTNLPPKQNNTTNRSPSSDIYSGVFNPLEHNISHGQGMALMSMPAMVQAGIIPKAGSGAAGNGGAAGSGNATGNDDATGNEGASGNRGASGNGGAVDSETWTVMIKRRGQESKQDSFFLFHAEKEKTMLELLDMVDPDSGVVETANGAKPMLWVKKDGKDVGPFRERRMGQMRVCVVHATLRLGSELEFELGYDSPGGN